MEPAVIDTAPSGEAISPKDDVIKDIKPLERKGEEFSKEPIASTSLLSIDTS